MQTNALVPAWRRQQTCDDSDKATSQEVLPYEILQGVTLLLYIQDAVSFSILQPSVKVLDQVLSYVLAVHLENKH